MKRKNEIARPKCASCLKDATVQVVLEVHELELSSSTYQCNKQFWAGAGASRLSVRTFMCDACVKAQVTVSQATSVTVVEKKS